MSPKALVIAVVALALLPAAAPAAASTEPGPDCRVRTLAIGSTCQINFTCARLDGCELLVDGAFTGYPLPVLSRGQASAQNAGGGPVLQRTCIAALSSCAVTLGGNGPNGGILMTPGTRARIVCSSAGSLGVQVEAACGTRVGAPD